MGKVIKNPQYFRLMKDGHFVGFGRITCEFLKAGGSIWLRDAIEYDDREILSRPPMGVANTKRELYPKE